MGGVVVPYVDYCTSTVVEVEAMVVANMVIMVTTVVVFIVMVVEVDEMHRERSHSACDLMIIPIQQVITGPLSRNWMVAMEETSSTSEMVMYSEVDYNIQRWC